MKCVAFSGGDFRVEGGVGHSMWQGLEKAGYKLEQLNPRAISLPHIPGGDLYISNGMRTPTPDICEVLNRRGIDLVIYDLGYILRSKAGYNKGYYQMGLNRIGWVPNFECPSDRFDNLGLKIVPVTVDRSNKRVLVCAQKPGDAQHGMNDEEMTKWVKRKCSALQEMGFTPVYRKHPMSELVVEGYEVSDHETLEEAAATCQFMVSYNSTAGVEALLVGKPVVVDDPDCHYKEVSSEIEEGKLVNTPSEGQLRDYFHRLAYAQWKLSEIRTGLPFQFLVKYINGNNPFDGTDYTIHQPIEVVKEETPLVEEATPQEGVPSCEEFTKSLEGLRWFEKRAKVKELTGELPRNTSDLERLVQDHYNG